LILEYLFLTNKDKMGIDTKPNFSSNKF